MQAMFLLSVWNFDSLRVYLSLSWGIASNEPDIQNTEIQDTHHFSVVLVQCCIFAFFDLSLDLEMGKTVALLWAIDSSTSSSAVSFSHWDIYCRQPHLFHHPSHCQIGTIAQHLLLSCENIINYILFDHHICKRNLRDAEQVVPSLNRWLVNSFSSLINKYTYIQI